MRHRARRLRGHQGGRRARGLRDARSRARSRVGPATSFVCIIQVHLHFPDNESLKGKRKELQSLKAQLQRRFGAAVSETEHHDLWQRSTLTAALVGRSASVVDDAGVKLTRYVESQYPDGVRIERALVSSEEILT